MSKSLVQAKGLIYLAVTSNAASPFHSLSFGILVLIIGCILPCYVDGSPDYSPPGQPRVLYDVEVIKV